MSTPFVGEIRLVGFNFNPVGWVFMCNGSLLAISQYEVLYTLIGTTYGGNGVTSFALPDLRGRAPIHFGNGVGLSPYVIGQQGGVTGVTISTQQLPSHSHAIAASSSPGSAMTPTGNYFGPTSESVFTPTGNPVAMSTIVGNAGGNQPHENRQPFLAMTYVIAWEGIFPSRS